MNEYRSQLRRMEEGPSKDKVRQEALPVLKKKKKLEIKLENLGIQLENLCQQQQRVQNSRENKQTVSCRVSPVFSTVKCTIQRTVYRVLLPHAVGTFKG